MPQCHDWFLMCVLISMPMLFAGFNSHSSWGHTALLLTISKEVTKSAIRCTFIPTPTEERGYSLTSSQFTLSWSELLWRCLLFFPAHQRAQGGYSLGQAQGRCLNQCNTSEEKQLGQILLDRTVLEITFLWKLLACFTKFGARKRMEFIIL